MHIKVTALRAREVADIIGTSTGSVYAAVAAGELDSYRVGTGRGSIRIPLSSLRSYAEARGIPLGELTGEPQCRLANCNGTMHHEGTCTVDLAATSLGYLTLVSYPDTDRRDLDVYSLIQDTITDSAEVREFAAEVREFAEALERGADALDATGAAA